MLLFLSASGADVQDKDTVITVGSASIQKTQTSISIPVNISAGQIFSGYQFGVRYNPKVLHCTAVRKGSLIQSFNILTNIDTPGTVRAGGFDPALTGVSGNGTFIEIEFEIVGSGISPISLSGVKLSNKDGKNIPVKIVNGRVMVQGDGDSQEDTTRRESDAGTAASIVAASTGIPAAGNRQTILRQPAERIDSTRKHPVAVNRPVSSSPVIPPQTGAVTPSENPVLLVQSEYGRPLPSRGMTSYTRGKRVTAEVEKEVFISEMEKAVCTGAKGEGSFLSCSENRAEFIINKDTKIAWQWKKVPADRDFSIEFDRKAIEFSGEKIEVPLKPVHYGGLTSPVKIAITKAPVFINAYLSKREIAYKKRSTLVIEKKPDIKMDAGRYTIGFEASCDGIKKEYSLSITVTGEVKKTVLRRENTVILTLEPKKNLESFDIFRLEIDFPDDLLKPRKVEPESVRYKLFGKDILALAGTQQEKRLSIEFETKKQYDDVTLDIRTFRILDSNNNSIPIRIVE